MRRVKFHFFGFFLFISSASLGQILEDNSYVDISISIFDMNLPVSELEQSQQNIYPQVRTAEVRYMPALLRAILQESDQWGVIRIVPDINESAELMISGSIIKSDGLILELWLTAVDSTGLVWIDQLYSSVAAPDSISLNALNSSNTVNGPTSTMDPFLMVYQQILADLSSFYSNLSSAEISQIKNMSFLRYAAYLSSDNFSPYIEVTEEGRYLYTNLPADNDPMVERVKAIRNNEYLFIDVVDEQYQTYLTTIKPIYDLWRKYTKELVQNDIDYQSRQGGSRQFNRGSYRALRESYDNFRWEKMQAQYLDQLSEGFSNEVLPTEMEVEDRVYELDGTLENQYWEWREILRELFELENG